LEIVNDKYYKNVKCSNENYVCEINYLDNFVSIYSLDMELVSVILITRVFGLTINNENNILIATNY
jgi:hypothetical protein